MSRQPSDIRIQLLSIPPFTIDRSPQLGPACLKAYLARCGYTNVRVENFARLRGFPETKAHLGRDGSCLAHDLPDLPLILTVIRNWKRGSHLLDGLEEELRGMAARRCGLDADRMIGGLAVFYGDCERFCRSLQADVAGFTTYEFNMLTTVLLSLLIRRHHPRTLIVYGGPQVTESGNTVELTLRSGIADAAVRGEGEQAFVGLLESFFHGGALPERGVVTRDTLGRTRTYAPQAPLPMDDLPLPDFSGQLGDLNLPGDPKSPLRLPVETSRGCTDRCRFCNEWASWGRHRRQRPEVAADMMDALSRDHGAPLFRFSDSLMNSSHDWTMDFSEQLLRRGSPHRWFGFFRAQSEERAVAAMARAGLRSAFVGAETFDDETLTRMNKQRNEDDNRTHVERFLRNGVSVHMGVIVGFPGESENSFRRQWQACLDLARRHPGVFALNVEAFQLRPLTPIYDRPARFGIETVPWPGPVEDLAGELGDIVTRMPMGVAGLPDILRRYRIMTRLARWINGKAGRLRPLAYL